LYISFLFHRPALNLVVPLFYFPPFFFFFFLFSPQSPISATLHFFPFILLFFLIFWVFHLICEFCFLSCVSTIWFIVFIVANTRIHLLSLASRRKPSRPLLRWRANAASVVQDFIRKNQTRETSGLDIPNEISSPLVSRVSRGLLHVCVCVYIYIYIYIRAKEVLIDGILPLSRRRWQLACTVNSA